MLCQSLQVWSLKQHDQTRFKKLYNGIVKKFSKASSPCFSLLSAWRRSDSSELLAAAITNIAMGFAETFYHSNAWRKCREGYAASVGGLCERCYKNGIIRAGVDVHHSKRITPANICDPDNLNWDNLILLCEDCHALEHTKKRWKVLPDGKVVSRI